MLKIITKQHYFYDKYLYQAYDTMCHNDLA